MARSTRNDAQRQLARKVKQSLSDLAELAVCEEDSLVELGPALDTLELGHAGLRKECCRARVGWYRAPLAADPRLRDPSRCASDARRGSVRRYIVRDRHDGRKRDSSRITVKSRQIEISCPGRRWR